MKLITFIATIYREMDGGRQLKLNKLMFELASTGILKND